MDPVFSAVDDDAKKLQALRRRGCRTFECKNCDHVHVMATENPQEPEDSCIICGANAWWETTG